MGRCQGFYESGALGFGGEVQWKFLRGSVRWHWVKEWLIGKAAETSAGVHPCGERDESQVHLVQGGCKALQFVAHSTPSVNLLSLCSAMVVRVDRSVTHWQSWDRHNGDIHG